MATDRLYKAAKALLDDVKARHPGEEFHCPFMRELDASLSAQDGAVGVKGLSLQSLIEEEWHPICRDHGLNPGGKFSSVIEGVIGSVVGRALAHSPSLPPPAQETTPTAQEIDSLAQTVGTRFVPNTCHFGCSSLDECKRRPRCENDDIRRASPAQEAGEEPVKAAKLYIRDWCPDHVRDYVASLDRGDEWVTLPKEATPEIIEAISPYCLNDNCTNGDQADEDAVRLYNAILRAVSREDSQ